MSGGSGISGGTPSTNDQHSAESSEPCRRLTFVSHAGEEKDFVKTLLREIERTNVAAFFDDDMAMGTHAVEEMTTRAATADQGVVVLSRSFLTKDWPMFELKLFFKESIPIYPLYYGVSPDQLGQILNIYDSRAGDDEPAFRLRMQKNPREWKELMDEVAKSTRHEDSTSLPNPMCWRDDIGKLMLRTGLRREGFPKGPKGDLPYATAAAKIVSPPVLPATIPPLPGHFINLDIVEDVISEVLDHAPITHMRGLVLTGIGGAGKSVIASKVVRDKRIRRQFADGVLWLDQQPGEYNEDHFLLKLNMLSQQLREVVLSRYYRQGRDMQYTSDNFLSVIRAQEFFKMWHIKYNLKCLLVVDNTWNVQVLQAVSAMGFQILATTRKETSIPASPGWRSKAVPQMGKESSLLVLQECSGAKFTAQEPLGALEVARECAFLPLALTIAGSTLRGAGKLLSSDTWLKLYQKLRIKADESPERDALNNILAVSIDELGQTRRDLFCMLAVLGNGILAPTQMLCHLWGEKDMEGARFLADGLVSRSLLQPRMRDHYGVHDALLNFAKINIKHSSSNVRDDATSRQATFLGRIEVLLAYSGGDRADMDAGLFALQALWLSLKELGGDSVSAVKEYTASLEDLERSDEGSEWKVADTRCAVARVFQLQGNLAEAESLYDRAISVTDNSGGREDAQMGIWLNNLGALKFEQGDYPQAVGLLDRAHAIREKVLGPKHHHVAQSFMNRAQIMSKLGEHAVALELLDRADSIFKEAYGETRKWMTGTLEARAHVFICMGKFEDARSLLDDAVVDGEETLGPEHPKVASFLNGLGSALLLQEKFKKAEEHFERSRIMTENTLGPRNLGVVPVINNLAESKKYRGDYDGALKLFQDAMTITEEVVGSEHSDIGTSLNNQAVVLVAQAKHRQAEKLCAEAAWIFVKAYGSESHYLVSHSMNNWAEALMRQGRYDMAILLFERAVKIRSEKLGRSHQETQHTTHLLQQARMECIIQARQLHQQPTGGSGRLDAKSLAEAGTHCFAHGDLDQAHQWYSSALEDGRYDPLAWTIRFRASVLINRATILFLQRDFGRCVADCSAALEVDPGRAEAYVRRFLAKQQLGQTDDALGDALKALMIAMETSMEQETPSPVTATPAATAPMAQPLAPSPPHASAETSVNAPPATASAAPPAGGDRERAVESIDPSLVESLSGQAQAERDMQLATPFIGPEVRPDEGDIMEESSGEMTEEEELRQAIELSLSPGVPHTLR